MAETNFHLLSSTQQTYHTLQFAAPNGGLVAGAMYKLEDTIGIVVESKDEGETAVLVTAANKIYAPCAAITTGTQFLQGSVVYYDVPTKKITETVSSNRAVGCVVETPSVGDTKVLIDFSGLPHGV